MRKLFELSEILLNKRTVTLFSIMIVTYALIALPLVYNIGKAKNYGDIVEELKPAEAYIVDENAFENMVLNGNTYKGQAIEENEASDGSNQVNGVTVVKTNNSVASGAGHLRSTLQTHFSPSTVNGNNSSTNNNSASNGTSNSANNGTASNGGANSANNGKLPPPPQAPNQDGEWGIAVKN